MKLTENDFLKLQLAIDLQAKNEAGQALEILNNLIQAYPENRKVLAAYGLLLTHTNKHKKAIPYLEKVLTTNSKNELIHLSLNIIISCLFRRKDVRKSLSIVVWLSKEKPCKSI